MFWCEKWVQDQTQIHPTIDGIIIYFFKNPVEKHCLICIQGILYG